MKRNRLFLLALVVACGDSTGPEARLSAGTYHLDAGQFVGRLSITSAIQGEPLGGATFLATNLGETPSTNDWNSDAWRLSVNSTFDLMPSLILRIRPTASAGNFCERAVFQSADLSCSLKRR